MAFWAERERHRGAREEVPTNVLEPLTSPLAGTTSGGSSVRESLLGAGRSRDSHGRAKVGRLRAWRAPSGGQTRPASGE